MARSRKIDRLVNPDSSSHPNPQGDEDAVERRSWIDSKALEAHSVVSEDDAAAYFASLPKTPCYDLIKPTMDERVSDYSRRDSEEDWFYVYDYCLTTLGVRMPFINFQMRVLSYLRICPTQFHPNGWAFARAYEIICNYFGIHASTILFFHLFQVNRVAGKGKVGWVTLKNANQRRIFTPYSDIYKRKIVPFHFEYWRVVSRPGTHSFWINSRLGIPYFIRWWTREHNFQPSSRYYVIRTELGSEQESFMRVLEKVASRNPISCKDLIDATSNEVIAILDSIAKGTRMATMRRAFLTQLAQNTVPQPLNITPGPTVIPPRVEESASGLQKVDVAGGSGTKHMVPQLVRRTKQKRDSRAVSDPEGDGSKKQKQQWVELKVGSSDSRTPNKTPSVWDEHFIRRRNATTHLLKAASSVRHMERHYLPLLKGLEEDRKEALAKVKVLSEQSQKLTEENKKLYNIAASLVEDLKKANDSLDLEKHSKDLVIRDRDEMKEKYKVTLAQVKGVKDQYLEAKEENDKMLKDLQAVRTGLENALKKLEESKKIKVDLEAKVSVLEDTKSELEKLREKYNDVLLHLGEDMYQNTIQQLMILNPSLIVHGSAPQAYMDNGVIMIDTLQGPIPFMLKVDDHQEAKHSGIDRQPQLQEEEVESKDRAINLD
ncbi:hypothetical protein SESBI_29269 [Sesbania bispinosa]|nr:hypothetical protein SESBI_29269 [Sesbania bispinosa]